MFFFVDHSQISIKRQLIINSFILSVYVCMHVSVRCVSVGSSVFSLALEVGVDIVAANAVLGLITMIWATVGGNCRECVL